ncbi:cold shock domain-containing protein [Stutzerimonas nitrititolerans]|uniref:cold shock domain-containing protein n=1 Tax=Stutzerimonas nitrititolerans TaxID=2482751 RepID=UPI0028A60B96|nr:cold shock domain-containing protein [Stutzerimonas nitrititolerans]
MKGKIVSWKDEKGFGFISPEGKNEQVFFHISSVKKATRKPEVGDTVIFEIAKDSQGRLKATHVLLEGVSLSNSGNSKRIVTAPVKKDALDYFAYFVLAVLLVISLGLFIKTGAPESALVPGAFFLIVMFFVSSRKKHPANKLFSCSKCRAVASHDERTVLAWNRGFNRLYCKSCHQAWLCEQPKEQQESRSSYASSKSGCLGLFLVIASVPIICVVGAVTWIV